MVWIANTEIGLGPNKSVIKRLLNIRFEGCETTLKVMYTSQSLARVVPQLSVSPHHKFGTYHGDLDKKIFL